MAYIHDCDLNRIDASTLFGEEAEKLLEACRQVCRQVLYPSNDYNKENYSRQFRVIYGIARRHHIRLDWDGRDKYTCMPDRWEIYKNGKHIGRINV